MQKFKNINKEFYVHISVHLHKKPQKCSSLFLGKYLECVSSTHVEPEAVSDSFIGNTQTSGAASCRLLVQTKSLRFHTECNYKPFNWESNSIVDSENPRVYTSDCVRTLSWWQCNLIWGSLDTLCSTEWLILVCRNNEQIVIYIYIYHLTL